ncbi:hypothetical protein C2845_PM10G14790 [Panicum miliaceum]|uniref:Uncharacterized protein n=1 Tax=Panicum miliaceum TaxID=4540 RepID=A0A3L6PK16_PANMI|nr:hypothetical protein C2845_PM10G14790 [Panicum miliaceum]
MRPFYPWTKSLILSRRHPPHTRPFFCLGSSFSFSLLCTGCTPQPPWLRGMLPPSNLAQNWKPSPFATAASGLEEGDQQRDGARATDGGAELGQPEQRACGVLPRGGRRGELERLHQRPHRAGRRDVRVVPVADGEVEQRRDAVLLQQRARVRQQPDERPHAPRRGDADAVVRVVLGQHPELHGRAPDSSSPARPPATRWRSRRRREKGREAATEGRREFCWTR